MSQKQLSKAPSTLFLTSPAPSLEPSFCSDPVVVNDVAVKVPDNRAAAPAISHIAFSDLGLVQVRQMSDRSEEKVLRLGDLC